jgi:transcriptional regulator with XRE-family HTH domain
MATTARRPRSLFGEILRRELEAQNVSTRELARRLTAANPERIENMRRALIRYIRGEVAPGPDARLAIASALGIDPALFADDPVRERRREIIEGAVENLVDVLVEAIQLANEKASEKAPS